VWLYWTGFVILVGAELNSELLKLGKNAGAPAKPPTPPEVRAQAATISDD